MRVVSAVWRVSAVWSLVYCGGLVQCGVSVCVEGCVVEG